jgi:hypothetical protein
MWVPTAFSPPANSLGPQIGPPVAMRDVHCIVAKTYDAKTMGIYVGMPV